MERRSVGWWPSPVAPVRSVGSAVLVLVLARAHHWAVESLGGLLAGLESETIGFIDGVRFVFPKTCKIARKS